MTAFNLRKLPGSPLSQRALPALAGVAFAVASATFAQQPPAGAGAGAGSPLPDSQEVVRDRVTRLEDRLFQLSQALKKAEPEKAARLLDSLGASRSLLVRQKIEEIVAKLRTEQYADAIETQEALTADLRQVLKLMLEEPDKLEDRKQEIERAEAARQALEKIVQAQRKLADQAQAAATTEAQAAALRAAQEAVQKALDLQQRLRTQTQGKPTDAAGMQADQRKLAEETEQLARQVQQATEPEATEPTPDGPASQVSGAAKRMEAAANQLGQNQQADADAAQREAEEKLAESLRQLKQRLDEVAKKAPLDEQAAGQKQTAEQTKQLSDEMQPQGASPDGGGSEGAPKDTPGAPSQDSPQPSPSKPDSSESQDSPPPEGKEPLPGQKDVQGAVPLQEKAAEDLKISKPGAAHQKQQKALKKLEEAQQKLEDTLEQMRKEQQEELLANLEARFRAMLEAQVQASKATRRLGEMGREKWRRSDQLELADVAHRQTGLGTEAEKALYILTEDGTTVIFPQILRQVRDDAKDAGTRLASADVGPGVRAMQASIEQALRELIDAVVQQQKENENQGESQAGEGGSSSPLLPGSAELKLLRSCQVRVNTSTATLDEARTAGADAARIEADLKKLSERQEQVSNMARSMHESMTRPQ